MGFAKNMMMQQDEQGWSFSERHVCAACVDEEALEEAIHAAEEVDEACDFCGSVSAAPLDALLEVFVAGLFNEYEDAVNGVSWDGSEGGYQWDQTWDTWDLIDEFQDLFVGEGLLDVVRGAVHERTWVERDFVARRQDEVLADSWDRFCQAVQYKTRYVFWLAKHDDDDEDRYAGEVPAARILDEIGRLVTQLGLVRALPTGHKWWRAQAHNEPMIDHTATRLGTVPRDLAKRANRMNPAGIPMFYGACDPETAICEAAVGTDACRVTFALFETLTECNVVDFTSLPPVPSMFDPEWGRMRRQLLFLNRFVDQLSDRARPTYEQIDYVPTQVVTEYLLKVHEESGGVQGLLYRSSLTGDVCAVLDIANEGCCEPGERSSIGPEPKLLFVPETVSVRSITGADRESRLRG